MAATVVQPPEMEPAKPENENRIDVFRWQKWVDGDGKLWIVTCLFGFSPTGCYGAKIELLNVDQETTIDVPRKQFELWVRAGNLKRVDTPILL